MEAQLNTLVFTEVEAEVVRLYAITLTSIFQELHKVTQVCGRHSILVDTECNNPLHSAKRVIALFLQHFASITSQVSARRSTKMTVVLVLAAPS